MTIVTKKTTLAELMDNPKAVGILTKHNVPCVGCPFAKYEMNNLRIGDICKMYSIDIGNLLKELNTIYKKGKK